MKEFVSKHASHDTLGHLKVHKHSVELEKWQDGSIFRQETMNETDLHFVLGARGLWWKFRNYYALRFFFCFQMQTVKIYVSTGILTTLLKHGAASSRYNTNENPLISLKN